MREGGRTIEVVIYMNELEGDKVGGVFGGKQKWFYISTEELVSHRTTESNSGDAK